jgi:hypothetical protein
VSLLKTKLQPVTTKKSKNRSELKHEIKKREQVIRSIHNNLVKVFVEAGMQAPPFDAKRYEVKCKSLQDVEDGDDLSDEGEKEKDIKGKYGIEGSIACPSCPKWLSLDCSNYCAFIKKFKRHYTLIHNKEYKQKKNFKK